MMNDVRVKLAMAAGLSWLCANCDKYKKARAAGIAGHDCMAAITARPCASPLGGMSFPEYEGAVSDFARFCFVCGDKSVRGMRARGGTRVFGVCKKHGPEWSALKKVDTTAAQPLAPEITRAGDWFTLDKVPRKKALGEYMLEFDPQSFDPIPDPNDPEEKK